MAVVVEELRFPFVGEPGRLSSLPSEAAADQVSVGQQQSRADVLSRLDSQAVPVLFERFSRGGHSEFVTGMSGRKDSAGTPSPWLYRTPVPPQSERLPCSENLRHSSQTAESSSPFEGGLSRFPRNH